MTLSRFGNYKDENLNQQTYKVPDFTLSPNDFKLNHLPKSICDKLPTDDRRKKIAGFLTKEQKREILYNNAAKFLRISKEEIAKQNGN
jgi:hypothetical protein